MKTNCGHYPRSVSDYWQIYQAGSIFAYIGHQTKTHLTRSIVPPMAKNPFFHQKSNSGILICVTKEAMQNFKTLAGPVEMCTVQILDRIHPLDYRASDVE